MKSIRWVVANWWFGLVLRFGRRSQIGAMEIVMLSHSAEDNGLMDRLRATLDLIRKTDSECYAHVIHHVRRVALVDQPISRVLPRSGTVLANVGLFSQLSTERAAGMLVFYSEQLRLLGAGKSLSTQEMECLSRRRELEFVRCIPVQGVDLAIELMRTLEDAGCTGTVMTGDLLI